MGKLMEPKDAIPLTETSFFILLSLVTPKHGYAIIKEVKRMSKGRVSLAAGTLYTALRRMLENGWIERVDERHAEDSSEGHERKLYELTAFGQTLLNLETDRLKTMLKLASKRKIADQGWTAGRELYTTSG
jgi:DNA-binding PadR family transcriptional regulator